ncbi:MAG TPA: AI-2E family transporter [Candidatus Andersenbacteria bacterium]|nr:AI-2E family transporter [Candidatus Andersenbacteria bacterium]
MAKGTLIDISSSTILRVILFGILFWSLFMLRDVLLMLTSAVIIACAIEPLAQKLRTYRVPRGVSVVIVYLLVVGVIAAAVTLILPILAAEMVQLSSQIPQVIHGIEEKMGGLPGVDLASAVPQLQQSLSSVGDNLTNVSTAVFEQTRSIFSGVLSLVLVFIIAFYLVIEEDALKKLFRFVVPRQHMAYVELMIDRIQRKLGRWVLAQMFLGLVIGVSVGFGLWAIGVKYAFTLGLVAGLLEVFPVIGPMIAGVLGTAIALSQSLTLGLLALVLYVIIQQTENHILIPNIMRKATGLNPLVTLIAVLLGGRLAGLSGVILSVPVATIISIMLADFFSTANGDDELAG